MSFLKRGSLSLIAGILVVMSRAQLVANPIDTTIATYYIPSTYTDASKTNTTVEGAYGYFGLGTSSLECGYDQILSTQSKGSVQQNYLGIYTYYLPTMKFRLGYVGIRPNGGDGNGDVAILGAGYDQYNEYGYKSWTAGSDAFVSVYSGSSKLTVAQLSPFATYYMASGWGVGWFELTGKVNGVFISDNRNMYSEEAVLKYNFDPFMLSATYYLGESTYGAFNGGFVVFNTNDKLQTGYALSGSYALGPMSLILNYQFQNMIASGETRVSSLTKVGGLLTYHF